LLTCYSSEAGEFAANLYLSTAPGQGSLSVYPVTAACSNGSATARDPWPPEADSRGSWLRYGCAMDSAPSGLVAARSAALRPGRSRRFHGSQRSGAAERPRRAPRPISPRVGAADRARALLTGARQRHPHRHRQPPLYTPRHPHRQPPLYTPRRPIGTSAGLLRLQPPPSAPPLWIVAPPRQQPSHYRTPAPPLALPHACTAPCTTARLHRPRTTGAHRCRAPTKARMHVGREALS
jgi:hypothetical protein